jgi:D-alanyl-D-alanine carboxypeptidase
MSLTNAQILHIQNALKTAINAAIEETIEHELYELNSNLDSWDIADDVKTEFEADIDELCDNAGSKLLEAAMDEAATATLRAVAEYEDFVLPSIQAQYEQDGVVDGPARREAWCNLIDRLNKSGVINDAIAAQIDSDVESL